MHLLYTIMFRLRRTLLCCFTSILLIFTVKLYNNSLDKVNVSIAHSRGFVEYIQIQIRPKNLTNTSTATSKNFSMSKGVANVNVKFSSDEVNMSVAHSHEFVESVPLQTPSKNLTNVKCADVKMSTGDIRLFGRDYSSLLWPQHGDWRIKPLFTEKVARAFMTKVHSLRVITLEKGCSTSKHRNRLATLEDGTHVCCRTNNIGNVYSYHLNRLLGLWNIPPVTAVKLNLTSDQWSSVQEVARLARWRDGSIMLVELFVDDLKEENILPYFTENSTSVLSVPMVYTLPLAPVEKRRMIQWIDMILFDFLIGHTDRVFHNLYHHHMDKPVKNLYKTPSSQLLLIDNECAFACGYPGGMYNIKPSPRKYGLQASMLRRTCAFRGQTLKALLRVNGSSPFTVLQKYVEETDPYIYSVVGPVRKRILETLDTAMSERVQEIVDRLKECQSVIPRC